MIVILILMCICFISIFGGFGVSGYYYTTLEGEDREESLLRNIFGWLDEDEESENTHTSTLSPTPAPTPTPTTSAPTPTTSTPTPTPTTTTPAPSTTPGPSPTPGSSPINCVQSAWGECSNPCGPGVQTRSILTQPQNNGTPCGPNTRNCEGTACPVDCVQSAWGECSNPCGPGVQTRTVITPRENGGRYCGPSTKECVGDKCPVDCVHSYWSRCSAECGGGTQTRGIVTQPLNGGAPCGELTRRCNEIPCDEAVGPWCCVDYEDITGYPVKEGECGSQYPNGYPCSGCRFGEWTPCNGHCLFGGRGTQVRSASGPGCGALGPEATYRQCQVECP